jgi:predicted dehydrogenase
LRELLEIGVPVTAVLRSRDPEREARLQSAHPEVAFSYGTRSVSEDPSITHVVIATPISTHVAVAEEFFGRDKSVFLEKPISADAVQAEGLLARAEETRTPLFVGQIFLYHECLQVLARELAGKHLRRAAVEKSVRQQGPESKEFFIDRFIHETSVLLKLLGLPSSALNTESGGLAMRFPRADASIDILPHSAHKVRRFSFETDDGTYRWENDELFLECAGKIARIASPSVPPLRAELQRFFAGADTPEVKENNHIALESVRVLEKAYESR